MRKINLRIRTDREQAEREALERLASDHGMTLVHVHHRNNDSRAVFVLETGRAGEIVNAINGSGNAFAEIKFKAATAAHRQVFTRELVEAAVRHVSAPENSNATELVEWMKANMKEHALITVKARKNPSVKSTRPTEP